MIISTMARARQGPERAVFSAAKGFMALLAGNTGLQNASTRKVYQSDISQVLDHERGDAPADHGDAGDAANPLAQGQHFLDQH